MINKCVICRRQRAKVMEQKMANLPADRITPEEPPFSKVGMDFFGPLEVKQGRSMVKRYGVVFVCLTSKAVHIEKANSLDTDACVNVIRRFMARRGQVKEIRSDNGTNLVGAEREMRKEINTWNQSRIHDSMLQKNVDWIFNPPAGSHHGGIWERQIRTIRKLMCSIVREQTLTDDSLHTLLCEIESILNNRPITTVPGESTDPEPLTPNHILLLKGDMNLPPAVTGKLNQYAKRRWKQVQYMSDLFWRRWTREYLPQLQERQKWLRPNRNAEVGDIVLVINESTPRNMWPLGKVVETWPNRDGFIRRVRVKTKNSILTRPVDKLCLLLEADIPDQETTVVASSSKEKSTPSQVQTPADTSTSAANVNSDQIDKTRTRSGRPVKPRKLLDL
ncbi:uncharacterized protein [Amphiura filiformis]|uniref:uncharacterized protein n=1 Tax=Amphiura filiformis TaxID=82378 RepID=UPI003B213C4C